VDVTLVIYNVVLFYWYVQRIVTVYVTTKKGRQNTGRSAPSNQKILRTPLGGRMQLVRGENLVSSKSSVRTI